MIATLDRDRDRLSGIRRDRVRASTSRILNRFRTATRSGRRRGVLITPHMAGDVWGEECAAGAWSPSRCIDIGTPNR